MPNWVFDAMAARSIRGMSISRESLHRVSTLLVFFSRLAKVGTMVWGGGSPLSSSLYPLFSSLNLRSGLVTSNRSRVAEDYAADLRNFHAPWRTLKILSAVCPGETNATDSRLLGSARSLTQAVVLAPGDIGDFLLKASLFDDGSVQLSVQQWNAGAYRPVPTIIEAASMIYVSNSVSDIQNKLSDHANLTSTITRFAEVRRWVPRGCGGLFIVITILSIFSPIRRAILMHKAPVSVGTHHIDIGAGC